MDSLYNRALSEVGQEGKFQIRFDVFYNVLLGALWSMAYNNIILALTITPHICKLSEKPANLSEYLWRFKYIPTVKDSSGGTKFSDCLIYTSQDNNDTEVCSIYDYDRTWFEATVSSDNNWVCENELYVANIFAYSKIGETIGSFLFGWFGDVYGRKPTYMISLVMLIIGRFISVIASSSFVLFAIGCIIASLPSWSATQSTAIISLEISSPKRRAGVAKLRLLSTSFGLCLMPLFYWWLRSWKIFMIFTTATQLPYLLFSRNLIESPQWLWVNREYKKCVQVLKHIANVNKTKLSTNAENEILTSEQDVVASKTEALGPLALFSGWRLAINTILQLLLWGCVSMNYAVVLLSSVEKSSGNPFLDFAWQSLAEIPGFFIASWLADRIGRRYTGMISTALTTLIWILYSFRDISSTEWLKSQWVGTSLVITNRLTITVSYYIINLLNMELYPTCLRQTGMSLGNVVSGGAGALAPYILHLYVKLNVGGTLFYTTIGTLTKSDNMLRTMFSGRMEVLTDSEGWILIDRCGKHFGTILNYLRDGTVALPDSYREIMELLAEAKYFLIEELTESCQQALAKKEREAEPICRVPLITSHKEEQLLIMSTSKPVVKLLINRHNNKYSYTSTSDDNLLKNIELFDKLSLRFSGRVLFIKDVIGSNEICCWSFFGHGKKCAEVCCTSIVYATDKKHTKVEFPEARIYEETLGILLYESRNGPDQDLIQATSSRGAVGGLSCTSDEEEERSGLARLRSNKQNNQS